MKIEVIYADNGAKGMTSKINEFLDLALEQGFMIIDYGIESKGGGEVKGVYGYVKYCDKKFLREYKIDSIMKEL